ncbi:MAG: type 4a pilus biogenesis protein PilO [Candidatus Omnitrophica bacterium]|nr:type 4a pilus biogenesis protein PilO [Candidatus Omnitrophota bacterium]MDD5351791.1 type 4a pilus biogenesis protein PilO [Candidatus Omnitrophota bacterium]MDD5550617.1 type 4a pilus biogenesis protein PilO [Candidatus Omnitrophota bacterium]
MDFKFLISKRERVLFIVAVIIISLAAVQIFIIGPIYREYSRLNQEINIKRVRLEKNRRLIKEKNVVKEDFKEYGKQLKTKGSDEKEMSSLLSEIEQIGNASGIYLSDVKPQKIKEMDFYKVMVVEIKFQATMQNLTKFIYEIQNSTLLLKVSRLQVNSKGGGSSLLEGILQVSKISLS